MKSLSSKTSDRIFIELDKLDTRLIVEYLRLALDKAHELDMRGAEKDINNYIRKFKSFYSPQETRTLKTPVDNSPISIEEELQRR